MAAADDPTLHVVAPGLLGPVPASVASVLPELGSLAALRRLLARAHPYHGAAGTPDGLLGTVLGSADPGAPGPVAAAVLGPSAGDAGYWSRAAGCHLTPDRDRLLVHGGPPVELDAPEAASIAEAFNRQFGSDGCYLHSRGGQLFLESRRPLPAGLAPLDAVAGHYLDRFLPAGAEAREWRSLLNECQMMLFEHPVNQAREASGRMPVNGLWFWGCGSLAGPLGSGLGRIHAGHPVWRGVAVLDGVDAGEPVTGPSALDPHAGPVLSYWADAESALATGDVMAWLQALARFDSDWAEPLVNAVRAGQWRRVWLHTATGRSWCLTRRGLRRFWRRPRPLSRSLLGVSEGEG